MIISKTALTLSDDREVTLVAHPEDRFFLTVRNGLTENTVVLSGSDLFLLARIVRDGLPEWES